MKTIGLLGGMSWESSVEYYRIINEAVHQRLGGVHSAQCVMYSVDFAEIEVLQSQGRWEEATQMMVNVARLIEKGGADFLLICTNTMHKMADDVQHSINIPLLHIADAAAESIKARGLKTVGLLGTRFTMEEDFYTGSLAKIHGLQVLIPDAAERDIIHRVIYDELVVGKILPESKAAYLRVIDHLVQRGAQGIILGCTEIGLLVKEGDCSAPLFDTTPLHALAAVDFALA